MLPGHVSKLEVVRPSEDALNCPLGQLAGVGDQAVSPGAGGTLLLPGGEVPGSLDGDRVLDPLDDLGLSHEVDLRMVGQDFINPIEEGIQELRVILQPRRVEEKSKWSSVLVKMSVEVVSQEVVKLIS